MLEEYKYELGKQLYNSIECCEEETEEFLDCLDELLKKEACVDYQDPNTENTPLMLAIEKDFGYTFLCLLSCLPNLELTNKEGISALHIASRKVNPYYLTRLCDEYVDLDLPDKAGNRAINYAIIAERLENIKTLMKKKCTLNYLNRDGLSIYDVACSTRNAEIINYVFNPKKKKDKKSLIRSFINLKNPFK